VEASDVVGAVKLAVEASDVVVGAVKLAVEASDVVVGAVLFQGKDEKA
jgi:hypothetical protein